MTNSSEKEKKEAQNSRRDISSVLPGAVVQLLEKITQAERVFVAFCLGMMVLMVLIQIFLRNFYQSGIVGGDSLVKHLVLWVAFLGAGLATREGSHIRIDVASKVFPEGLKPYVQVAVDVFSIIICSTLVYASYNFVAIEYEGQGTIPFHDIPVWMMEIIIPIGFLVITLRFAAQAVSNVLQIVKGSAH